MIYVVVWVDDDGNSNVAGAAYDLEVAKQVRMYGMDGQHGEREPVEWKQERHTIGGDEWWGTTAESEGHWRNCYHISILPVYTTEGE